MLTHEWGGMAYRLVVEPMSFSLQLGEHPGNLSGMNDEGWYLGQY